ncbi:MAG: hypothetical protein U0930_21865 [Pirellulales bacterium]
MSTGAILTATFLVALNTAGLKAYGLSAIGPAGIATSVLLFLLSRTKSKSLYPINRQAITWVELIVLIVICVALHGLLMPAVASVPHRN